MKGTRAILLNAARKQGRAFYAAYTRHLSKRELLVLAARTAQRQLKTTAERVAFLAAITEALEEAGR